MKQFELVSIRGNRGNYTAVLYNRMGGYYTEKRFLWYSKKDMFRELRRKHACVIRKGL